MMVEAICPKCGGNGIFDDHVDTDFGKDTASLFQCEQCQHWFYMSKLWTVDKVRAELPAVKVKFQGTIVIGKLSGRMMKFAQVHLDGSDLYLGEWSWASVAHALNDNKALIAD